MGKYLVLHPALPYDESLFGMEGKKGVVCELGKRRLSQTHVQSGGSGGAKKTPGAGDETGQVLFRSRNISFPRVLFVFLCPVFFISSPLFHPFDVRSSEFFLPLPFCVRKKDPHPRMAFNKEHKRSLGRRENKVYSNVRRRSGRRRNVDPKTGFFIPGI